MPKKKKVLMVCFGNTCRSPIAEAVFRKYVIDNNMKDEWEVDSAGLYGYHVGKTPNKMSLDVLANKGINDYHHVARIIKKEDFYTFDWIFGMDYYNISHLSDIQPQGSTAEIELLGQYDPEGEVVIEDPYMEQRMFKFEKIYGQCSRSIPVFIEKYRQRY